MAYNCKINTVTGYSPTFLAHGREFNKFSDWKCLDPSNEIAEILNRADEINFLNYDVRERALVNIQDAQERQKGIQDSRNLVQEERLEVGAHVMVKVEGVEGDSKLRARWEGPYTVARINPSGNYELFDSTGQLLPMATPFKKLKEIPAPGGLTQESWEVEKIVDAKKRGDKMVYKVRWKGYDESDDSWETESHFNSMLPIQAYYKMLDENQIESVGTKLPTAVEIASKKAKAKSRRGRKPKIKLPAEQEAMVEPINSAAGPNNQTGQSLRRGRGRPRVNPLAMLSIIAYFLFFIFAPIGALKIDGKFRLCDNYGPMKSILDINKSCHLDDKALDRNYFRYESKANLTILYRSKHLVYGKAYQCRETIITYTYYKNLFSGVETTTPEEKHTNLRRSDCEYMVRTKRCGTEIMDCDMSDTYCQKTIKPVAEFSRFTNLVKQGRYCSVNVRQINADSPTSKLYSSALSGCRVNDLECTFSDSIIIWDQSVIHPCPFEYLDRKEFKTWGGNKVTTEKLLFELIGTFEACNMTLHKTNEGLYMTLDPNAGLLPRAIKTPEIASFWALGELDNHRWDYKKKLIELEKRICTNFLSSINVAKLGPNGYFSVIDVNGNELILLNEDGTIFIPQCTPIDSITIEHNDKCYKDPSISFMLKGQSMSGFLQKNNVIVRHTDVVDCKNLSEAMIVDKFYIHRQGNGFKVLDVAKENFVFETISKMTTNLSEMNFRHSYNVIESSDIIGIIHNLTTVDDLAGRHLIENNLKEEVNSNIQYDPIVIGKFSLSKLIFLVSTCMMLLFVLIVILLARTFGIAKVCNCLVSGCRKSWVNCSGCKNRRNMNVPIALSDLEKGETTKMNKESEKSKTDVENRKDSFEDAFMSDLNITGKK
jgi:hypothetical protein